MDRSIQFRTLCKHQQDRSLQIKRTGSLETICTRAYTPMGAQRVMHFTINRVKMYYTDTKGTVKSIFRKWHQKGKARLNRHNTDNPMAP